MLGILYSVTRFLLGPGLISHTIHGKWYIYLLIYHKNNHSCRYIYLRSLPPTQENSPLFPGLNTFLGGESPPTKTLHLPLGWIQGKCCTPAPCPAGSHGRNVPSILATANTLGLGWGNFLGFLGSPQQKRPANCWVFFFDDVFFSFFFWCKYIMR